VIRVERVLIGVVKTKQVISLTELGVIKALGCFGSELDLQRLRSHGFTDEQLEFLQVLWEILPSDAIKHVFRLTFLIFPKTTQLPTCSYFVLSLCCGGRRVGEAVTNKICTSISRADVNEPNELYAKLEEFLKDSQGRYPSIFDVVKVAIIEFLKRQKC